MKSMKSTELNDKSDESPAPNNRYVMSMAVGVLPLLSNPFNAENMKRFLNKENC